MSKIKFQVRGTDLFSFNTDLSGSFSPWQFFLNLLRQSLVLIPFFYLIWATAMTSTYGLDRILMGRGLLIAIGLMLAVFVGLVIFTEGAVLVDPPLLLQILICSLVIIVSYMLSGNNPKNTFGESNIIYLGGIFMIVLLTFFYSLVTALYNQWWQLASQVFILISLLFFSISWTGTHSTSAGNIVANTSEALMAVPFILISLILMTLYFPRRRLAWVTALLVIPFTVVWLNMSQTTEIGIILVVPLVLTLIAAHQIWYHGFAWKQNLNKLKQAWRDYLEGKTDWASLVDGKTLGVWWLSKLTFVFWVLAIAWVVYVKFDIAEYVRQAGGSYAQAFNNISNWPFVVVGGGASYAAIFSMWRTVLVFSGLAGIVVYIILFASGLTLGWREAAKANKEFNLFWVGTLLTGIFMSLVYKLPLPLYLILFWALAGMAASKILDQRKSELNFVSPKWLVRFVNPSEHRLVQLMLFILILMGSTFVTYHLGLQIR